MAKQPPRRGRALAVLAFACGLLPVAGCQDASDKRARATRISTQTQLIGGPKALGEIGDYLLENDQIRVIIHGPGTNRASTLFPGSILDVDLARAGGRDSAGNDQMGEIAPAFLFEAFNPTDFTVTATGSDGGDAVLTVEGAGDDMLEAVALINTGFLFPAALRFRIEYRLSPGARYLEVVTTVINDSGSNHPLPYLDPPDLRDLGLDIPGLESLSLSVPFGHVVLFGGENKVFAPGPGGFNLRFAVEDSYGEAGGLPAFPGLVTDFIATKGDGVSYGIALPSSPANYPDSFSSLYPSQTVTDHSMLIPFLFSAVVGLYTANPPESLAPSEEFSYTIFVVVGKGDVGSVTDTIFNEIRKIPTGSFAGRLYDRRSAEPVQSASVLITDTAGNFVSQADSDVDGAFRLDLPVGQYRYQLTADARFPGDRKPFSIAANKVTSILEALESPATVFVTIRDQDGRALPSRITAVGDFADADRGRDPREFLYDLRLGESTRPVSFDPERTDFIEKSWYAADGRFRRHLRPGTYKLVMSRGNEYDTVTEIVTLGAGQRYEKNITLERTVDTTGYVAADLHLHSANSIDSGLTLKDRVISIAGEGVEYAAATDHNYITDYSHEIATNGLRDWLVSSVGLEVTTFEMGHFNGYPLKHDSGSIRGGTFEWVGQTPQSIFDQIRALGNEDTIVQVNHPRWDLLGYFNVFNIDQDLGEPVPQEGLISVFSPNGPEFELSNFSLDFDAVEIFNGKRFDLIHTYRSPAIAPAPPFPEPLPPPGEVIRDSVGQVAFPGAMEDWFAMLNQGVRFAGVAASDSHKLLGDEPGFPRTYVFVGADGLGQFGQEDVVAGLRSRNASVSMGPFVTFTVNGQPMGSDVTDSDGMVELEIRVQAPNWAPFDRVVVWSNAEIVAEFSPIGQERFDFRQTEAIAIASDAWFIVEVTGQTNLFPIVPPVEHESLSPTTVIGALGAGLDLSALDPFGNLRPAETFRATPLAFTNPIWVDRDGNGQFDASGASGLGVPANARAVRPEPRSASKSADVREWFEQFEDVR